MDGRWTVGYRACKTKSITERGSGQICWSSAERGTACRSLIPSLALGGCSPSTCSTQALSADIPATKRPHPNNREMEPDSLSSLPKVNGGTESLRVTCDHTASDRPWTFGFQLVMERPSPWEAQLSYWSEWDSFNGRNWNHWKKIGTQNTSSHKPYQA